MELKLEKLTKKAADFWDTMLLYVTTLGIILILITGYLAAGIFSECLPAIYKSYKKYSI